MKDLDLPAKVVVRGSLPCGLAAFFRATQHLPASGQIGTEPPLY